MTKSRVTVFLFFAAIVLFFVKCEKTVPTPPTNTTPVVVNPPIADTGRINISVTNTRQKVDLIGGGCYFNSGQLVGHPDFNSVANWLWNDLNVNSFRIVLRNGGVEDVNDNSDPNVTDFSKFNFYANTNNRDQIIAAKKALSINPNIKIWAVILSPQKFLKTNNDVNLGGTINTAVPNVYEEFGEVIYAHLKNLKDSAITVEHITLMNEPDFVSNTIGYESAHFTTTLAQAVYTNTANWLKTKLPQVNIQVPKFTGADCLDVSKTPSYIQALRSSGNITHFTTHQYANSTPSAFSAAANLAGNEGLYQTENTPAFGLPAYPQTTELQAAFNLVDNFNEAFQGGTNGWLYFEWGRANPNSGSLVYTPYPGAAVRKKNYYTFQQYTKNILQQRYVPLQMSNVTNISAGEISAFTSGNKLDLHVMNKSLTAQNNVKITFDVNVSQVQVFRTNDFDDNKLISTESNVNKNNIVLNLAANSFTTIRVIW